MSKLKKLIIMVITSTAILFSIGCSSNLGFINNQPVYFGDRVTPAKTVNSPNINYLKWKIYGTDEKSSESYSSTTGNVTRTTNRSATQTQIAANVAKYLGNDPTKFLSNAELKITELSSYGWLIRSLDFSSKLYQMKK